MEPASAAVLRIIDTQALKIDQLEKEQQEHQKNMKAVEWVKMELQSATSANNRWKELCDNLQDKLAESATSNLQREQRLHHTVAERNQQIITLRVAQEQLTEQLLEVKESESALHTKCEGLETLAANIERLDTCAATIGIDVEQCDRLQKHMLKSRQQVADAREAMLQAKQDHEETKIALTSAKMELDQAAVNARTQELRAEHTNSLQEELSKARNDLQELLQVNRQDEITLMQRELSRSSLQCTRESARADAAEAEVQQLLDVVPERDALKDKVATLQHALNDMQTTMGAVDVRDVLQRYQARERTSEQLQEQLRTRIDQLETQEGSLQEQVGSLKAKSKELQVRLSSSESHVERLQGLKRTSAGEISFLRARLDFHLTASATAAKRNAAAAAAATPTVAAAIDVAPQSGIGGDVDMSVKDFKTAPEVPESSATEAFASMVGNGETTALQGCLDNTRKQVDVLENSIKDAGEKLAAAEAARTAAEIRVEQEQKVVEQLKLALELQRLTAHAQVAPDDATTMRNMPSESADAAPENGVHRELCDHQVLLIQRENERLRDHVLALSKAQAEHRVLASSKQDSDTADRDRPTSHAHALLAAQLAVAQQKAEDYQARISKLSGFFADSMHGMRQITEEVLGWKLSPHRTVGEQAARYTFACAGSADHTLTAKNDEDGDLGVTPSQGWAGSEHADTLISKFQEGELSTPVLAAQLLLSSADEEIVGREEDGELTVL